MAKKLDGNYTRMLWAKLNKSWRQHPTKQQLYGHLPPIMKTIQVRRTRHVGYCWRSRGKLISNTLLWTPSHGWAKAGQPARTYIQQLCADTGCSLEDLLGVMDNRDGWWERVREICAGGVTWWWWTSVVCAQLNGFMYSKWRNSFIWFMDETLTPPTTLGQSRPDWLVGFYGISTLLGYLMPNPACTYIYQIYMICK